MICPALPARTPRQAGGRNRFAPGGDWIHALIVAGLLVGMPSIAQPPALPGVDPDLILFGSEPLPAGGWRVHWTSEPGRTYVLQRWAGDGWNERREPAWQDLLTVVASGQTCFGDDLAATDAYEQYYRVVWLPPVPVPDTFGPVLAGFRADRLGATATALVRLRVVATDDAGVAGVAFEADAIPLGDALREGDEWSLVVPPDGVLSGKRQITARARDALGNIAVASIPVPPPPSSVGRFTALDGSGLPDPDSSVTPVPGALPPLEFRPTGRNTAGSGQGLIATLPEGAVLATVGNREVLRFTRAAFQFGRDSALRFDDAPFASINPTALARRNAGAPTSVTSVDGVVNVTSGTPLEIPAGPLTAADLEAILGLAPGEGVPLRVFDRFSLRWHQGVLEEDGIRGGRFSFADLPLPALSGDYPDHVVSLSGASEFRLPFHGVYTWPDAAAAVAPEMRVGPADPGWLTLRADGSMDWHNRSEIILPGGGRIRVDIGLDDPFYRLAIFADSVQVPLLGNLAALILPDNPAACLPGNLDPVQLARATECLQALGRAYWNVSASAVAAAPIPADPEIGGLALPPDDLDTSLSVLEAWTQRALAFAGSALPLAPQRELLRHTGHSASAATDLVSAARHRAALARATTALHRGALSGSAEDQAALESALDEATAAALLRARDPFGVATLAALHATLEALIETQVLLAEAGRPQNSALHAAVGGRLQDFLEHHLSVLGVTAGQFGLNPDSAIGQMNRFVVFQNLRDLLDTLAQAALLGVDDALDVPIHEALTQMAQRLWILLAAAFDDAEAAEDVPGFQFAFEDLLDLAASRKLSIFPNRPELDAIPTVDSVAFRTVLARLDTLWGADLERPYPERSLVNETAQLRRLLRILREVPADVTLASPPFERAHERVNAKLAEAVGRLDSITRLDELQALLEAGILNETLRVQFALPATANWEGTQLPAFVARFAAVGASQRAWSELNRAREILRREADRFATRSDQVRRRLYLEQTVPILVASRDVAVALWESERTRRDLSPLDVADLLLPGNLVVDKAAGAAMGDRHAGWLRGGFRGRLALPKYDGHFEVLNASFDHTGAFDLAAHGSAGFRGVTVGVPRRQPLTVSFRAPDDLRFNGEAVLALPNGMNFAARVLYDDPLYGFRIEARDLRFELLRELTLLRPTVNLGEVADAGDGLRRAYVDYFGSMNAALEALARQAGNLPDLDLTAIGEPPAYLAPQITLPFSELNAWSGSVLVGIEQNVNRSHALATASLREVFQTIHDDATLAAETLETEESFLELQLERLAVLRHGAKAFEAADERLLLGEEPDIAALTQVGRDTTRGEALLHQKHLFARPPKNLAETSRNLTVLLDLAGLGQVFGADFADLDEDGLPDATDNCPALWSSQPLIDSDNDGFGDPCDPAPLDPAIPGTGPCADALRLAGNPLEQAKALFACQLQRELIQLGLDPATAAVANPALFESLPSAEIQYRMVQMLDLEAHAEALGSEGVVLIAARLQLRDRLLAQWTAELAATPDANPVRQYELVMEIADLRSLDDEPPIGLPVDLLRASAPAILRLTDDELARLEEVVEKRREEREGNRAKRLDRDFARNLDAGTERLEKSSRRGLVGDSLVLLQTILGGLTPETAAYRTRVDTFIRHQVQGLREGLVDPQFLLNRLGEAESIARTLADFTAWAVATLPAGDPLLGDLRLALDDFTVQLAAVAEARRAWWLLHRYAVVLDRTLRDHGAAMGTELRATYRQSFAATVLASNRVLDALSDLADAVDLEEFKVRLPGELRVRRAFGGIAFNRETEIWTGSFGGRLEFPNFQKAFFEISQATLSTDGTFQIAAATGGPLPFGRLGLTTSLNLAGGLNGLQSVSGSGQLAVPQNNLTNLYAVTASYDFAGQRLHFDSQASGLDWRIADDFVLFNGGMGLELSTAEPEGALTFRGSAGLFARATPLPPTLGHTNFHLVVTNAAVRLTTSPDAVGASLTNGTLLLPEFFRTSLAATNRVITNYLATPQGQTSQLQALVLATPPGAPGKVGPAISLTPTNPITINHRFDPASLDFAGELLFRDLGFAVPGFEALEVGILQARLIFPTNQFPLLTNVQAALQFPLPNQTSIVEVIDGAWALDGYPSGTVRLRTNLDLLDNEGWRLTMLGSESALCPAGTGLTVARGTNGLPFLRLDAGVRFAMPGDVISDDLGEEIAASACGSLLVPLNQLPNFAVNDLAVSSSAIRLGGNSGLVVSNALLKVSGLTNLFQQAPDRPLLVGVDGMAYFPPGIGLGLSNAVFRFEGNALPRFTVSELAYAQSGSVLAMAQALPLNVSEARLRFLSESLPFTQLFAPTNLQLTLGGTVALPPGQNSVLAGRVDDLVVAFAPDGLPQFSLDTLGIKVDLTALVGESLPVALGGEVFVGGLNNPPNYLFAGKVRGNFKGNAVEGLLALDPCGVRGICFGLAGSEIAIQLAYGFVLTGARGGISLVNSNADPCDFLTFLPIDPVTGRPTGGSTCQIEISTNCPPAITREELSGVTLAATLAAATAPAAGFQVMSLDASTSAASSFPCPVLGECPPASVNLYCMPHPDSGTAGSPHANRVVMKFSALDESLLNALGLTPEFVAALVPQFSADPRQFSIDLAGAFRTHVDSLTPRAPTDAPPAIRALDAAIEGQLDDLELAFANTLLCALAELPANSADLASLLYAQIRDTAWAGVPCPDATLKLEGSVSYTGVSTFANLTGGVVFSTTGSAGVVGSVNVFGIPVGQARVFVNQTDARGNPTLPSICGEVVAAIGPLELGSLALLEDCPECTTKLFSAFANLFASLGDGAVDAVMVRAFPDFANPALNPAQHLALLDTDERRMIFLASLLNAPPRDSEGRIGTAFLDFITGLADAVQPRLSLCGEVQPKVFGFPLSGGGKFYSYQMYAGPKDVLGQSPGYLWREAYGFSPIQMFAYYGLAVTGVGSAAAFLIPAVDEAQVATTFELPTFGQIIRDSFTKPAPQFLAERTEDFLKSALMTYEYRLAPLGMELGRAGGRILLPSLEHHPRGPNPRTPPEERRQGLPGRLEVLLAALGDKDQETALNRLSDVTWKGEGNADFAAIFANSPYATAVSQRNLSLRDDYFPHGGFLGGGIMDLPALLTRPLPESLFILLDPTKPDGERLSAAGEFVFNHLTATERVGELAFYIPAPNPPLDRFPTTADELLASLRNFVPADPLQVTSYYPVDRGFLRGWFDTPVLGLPTIRSEMTWQPAEDLLRLAAEVPTNSWFNRYLGTARFDVDFRGGRNQTNTVALSFLSLSNAVARLDPASPRLGDDLARIANDLPRQLADGLPRVAMTLTASQVRIPVPGYSPSAPLTDAMTVARITNAAVEAYSPYYRRDGALGNNPLDQARRNGGFAVKGDFNFLNGLVSVPAAEFAVTPEMNPLGLPTVYGNFAGGPLTFFGVPFSAPPSGGRAVLAAPRAGPQVTFQSDDSAVRLDAQGSIAGLDLGALFRLVPLTGTAIGATATFESTTTALPQGRLALQPCRLDSTLLAGATLLVHGATTNDPFSLDSSGPWNVSITQLAGSGLDLRVGTERVLRLSRPAAASAQPFRASLSGDGLTNTELTFTNLHLGLVIESYPDRPLGDPRRRAFTLSSGATVAFQVNSDGEFELRANIPNPLSFAGLPVAGMQSGFEFRLANDGLFFSGQADGGLWSTLGGGPIRLVVAATSSSLTFRADATLPVLDFGVFRIDDGTGRAPRVTVTQSGIDLPAGLALRVNVAALGSPTLTLDRFTIGANGAFTVEARRAGIPTFDTINFNNATHTLARTATGLVTYSFAGEASPRDLPGFGSIAPRSGSTLRGTATVDSTGNGSLSFDAALLRLPLIGVTVDALLHGAGGTNAPFSFSTTGPWSAVATFPSLIADPPGTVLPEFIRLTPSANASAGLFTAAVSGNQGNLTSLSATRTGNVNLELFRDSPMARAFNNVNAGTLALAVTNNPRQLTLTLDPPDLAYSTNFVVNDKPVTVNLFRLSSGSLTVTIGGDGSLERSVKLDAPTLTLLPGTLLEQTLSALPTQTLAAGAFPLFTGTPVRTLAFPGLPVVRIPSGSSSLFTLTPTGFNSPIPFQEGTDYDGLVSLPATSSQLSLDFTGSRLRLRFANGPSATVLGQSVGLNGGEATLDVGTGGGFTGTFRTTGDPSKNLGFNLLSFQPSGTLTLGGLASISNPEYQLAGNFTLFLAYPNPSNPTQSLTAERNLAFDLEAGENFSATVTSGLPSFDLGWLRVQPGGDGHVVVTRNGSTGDFAVAFNDWDLRLFGVDYNNQDFALSSAGTLSRSLASSTFNLGSGNSLLRLVTGGTIPFEWVVNPAGSSAGRTFVDLPSTTALSFPSLPGLSGTLRDGLAFGSALADIPATGIFDRTWSRALTLNNLDFGTVSVRLRRPTQNGAIEFTGTRSNALWSGLVLSVSANTGSATSFAATLGGTFSLLGWTFGSANFTFDAGDPSAPFQGSATITDPSGTVGLTLNIKLRGGAQPCLEFNFNGPRQLCQP